MFIIESFFQFSYIYLTKMTWTQVFIVFVLIFIISCLVSIGINYSIGDRFKKTSGGVDDTINEESASNELAACSKEINQMAGGAERILSLKILDKMMPYLKEVKSSSDVEEYLAKYFEYPAKEIRELKDDLRTEAPQKYRFLHTLISDIVDRNSIESPEQFFEKSELTYQDFLPKEMRGFLTDAKRLGKVTVQDLKKVSKLLDDYLSDEGTYLTKHKLESETEEFIRSHKIFKLKADKVTMPPKKLEQLIEKDPTKVFELDLLGMIPAMHSHAVSKRKISKEDELKRQLEKDVETLELFRKYPDSGAYSASTIRDLARRMENAAIRLYGRPYATRLLEDLYRDYDYFGRRSSERERDEARRERETFRRERDDERRRREQAERERTQEEQRRRTAQQQQEAADRALAERLAREQEDERARERQVREREQERQREIERIHNLEQIALGKQHDADAPEIRERDAVNPIDEGIDPDIWKFGAKEKKDNIDTLDTLTDEEMEEIIL